MMVSIPEAEQFARLVRDCDRLRTQLATLTRERDEAVAMEAVMREALKDAVDFTACAPDDDPLSHVHATATAALATPSPRAEALLRVVEAGSKLKFGSYPAHGSGFVIIVTEGSVDDFADALRAREEKTDVAR